MDETVNLTAILSSDSEYISNNIYVNGSVLEKAVDNGDISIELSGSTLASFAVEDSNWSNEVSVPSSLSAGNYTIIV